MTNTAHARRLWLLLCLACVALPLAAQGPAARPDAAERDLGADRFVAGGTVSVTQPVAGDLVAAGGNVDVSAEVGGDAVVVGGNVRLGAAVKQGVYAAGGRVAINAPVQRNLRVAGGNVEIGPQAKIAGNVTIGGGDVKVLGAIDGYLQVGGGRVRIDAPIGGNVEVGGGHVELGPNARIAGKLRYASREELQRDPAAQVQGAIERYEARGGERPALARRHAWAGRAFGWVWSIGLMLAAALLVALLPALYSALGETVRTRWAASLLIGFIAMVCVPVVALIALITIIGLPIGLAVLALYPLLLWVGYVSAGIGVGELALRRWWPLRAPQRGWRIGAAAAGMFAISVLAQLPWLGALVALLALWLGLGALLLQWRPLAVGVASA